MFWVRRGVQPVRCGIETLRIKSPICADVAWSRVAAVLAVNRLCAPGSELAIEQRW